MMYKIAVLLSSISKTYFTTRDHCTDSNCTLHFALCALIFDPVILIFDFDLWFWSLILIFDFDLFHCTCTIFLCVGSKKTLQSFLFLAAGRWINGQTIDVQNMANFINGIDGPCHVKDNSGRQNDLKTRFKHGCSLDGNLLFEMMKEVQVRDLQPCSGLNFIKITVPHIQDYHLCCHIRHCDRLSGTTTTTKGTQGINGWVLSLLNSWNSTIIHLPTSR